MSGKKDFAKLDAHRPAPAQSVLAQRYDNSRVVPFDAELAHLAPNPQNPRYPDDPKVQEMRASLLKVGQLQIAVIVTREAYIDAYPDFENGLDPKAKWVVFMGNRRLLAAKLAGWKTLEVVLARDVASADQIEDRIIHENIHREELPPLLLAGMYARKMQRERLSARGLADALGKSHAHVNNILSLQNLTSDWQAAMQAGELGVRDARVIARVEPERQRALFALAEPLRKLAPAAREMAYNGELDSDQIKELSLRKPAEQRAALVNIRASAVAKEEPTEPEPKPTSPPSVEAAQTVTTPAATPSEASGGNQVSSTRNGTEVPRPPAAVEAPEVVDEVTEVPDADDVSVPSDHATVPEAVEAPPKQPTKVLDHVASAETSSSGGLPHEPAELAALIRKELTRSEIEKLVALLATA